ncbi:5-dehydro-4-deoxy-D-glucuronate isomerase [Flavihumibacter stibioxidans]|uniref:4-deoxy-L-threo-5-hexosulose-uronate ketol-isomerase n=1 Tax=Flavihumibacter stibioxidans TaxID=1834163 RepID=A0ABR7M5N9_9BACT|nr:5-dehydro-4-deoxy-D-glucuronate isomerase [Flavihumibacter stibioxidans]MBC6490336.1 5-dehydro-4-deoxy-D-glucuronate isomerase [Flavihumibacter stibioxidans]
MEIRFQNSPKETSAMNTASLRENFLVQHLVKDDSIQLVYSHYDRVIIGGVKPVNEKLVLPNHPELRADFFLQRREIGIINVGGAGSISADGETFELNKLDCLYLGKGMKEVSFSSNNADDPAIYYLLSAPAHMNYPNRLLNKEEASPAVMGAQETSNHRTIYKYIHDAGIQSCQLVMGLTVLSEGSVWNTMPAHTHTRRMEAYFYFDVKPDQRVVHFMGEPKETRHLITNNHEAIISPPWSIHSGCGTADYAFIWGMAGENYTYTDMDPAPITELL